MNQPDIAQRIAAALARTSEPRPTGGGSMKEGGVVVGSVPEHLRHLHNLLDELVDEMAAAMLNAKAVNGQLIAARNLFSAAVKGHVPVPENATSMRILENWDVAVTIRSSAGHEAGELDELLAMLMAGGGGRR